MTPHRITGLALVRYDISGYCGRDCAGHATTVYANLEIDQIVHAADVDEAKAMVAGWVNGFERWIICCVEVLEGG